MRVPILNTDPSLFGAIRDTFARANAQQRVETDGRHLALQPIGIESPEAAIEFITYEMPALLIVNFSDPRIDAFAVMERVVADPWLNNGGIVALAGNSQVFQRVDELRNTNLLISLLSSDLRNQLPTVLDVVTRNRRILSQRSIQTELLSTISGQFELGMDLMLVPCYSNLIANYLYNMGFVDSTAKSQVALMLTEMLTNAIEHGNCGIGSEEKTAHLNAQGDIKGLIAAKCADPAIAARRVAFGYQIERGGSTFVIRDEGAGFDWRRHLNSAKELDFFSLHGRGILITANTASSIAYNEAGNEVTLTIHHRRNTSNEVPSAFRDSETVSVDAEQVIFEQGEESSFIYYIAEGEYRVLVNGQTVNIIRPEDMLMGEMSFLLEEVRSATIIANTPGKLIKISKEALINAIKTQPYYGMLLAKLLARRLQRQSEGRTSAN